MSAQWINARILKRGREYRVSIADAPASGEWEIAEEHSVCLDGSTDRASLEGQLDRLCEQPLSYKQAMSLLADLRGQVLERPVGRIVAMKYATFWLRCVARVTDNIVLSPVAMIGWFAFRASTTSDLRVACIVVLSCAGLLYQILMHGTLGQTLGKMACGVIVRDISERPLSMRQAVLRDIIGIILLPLSLWIYVPLMLRDGNALVPFDIPFPGRLLSYVSIGWTVADGLTILTNAKRRALHDFIARSVVIRTGS
jgi:uncharacterized RDD family membrane protein YckC